MARLAMEDGAREYVPSQALRHPDARLAG